MEVEEFIHDVKAYFDQLTREETYGWLAESLGFILVLVGAILVLF